MPSMSSDTDVHAGDSGTAGISDTASDSPSFETVEWSDTERSRRFVTAERVTLLVSVLLLGVLYLVDQARGTFIVADWKVTRIDFLFLGAVGVIAAYVVVPAITNRERTGQVLRDLWSRPSAVLASIYVTLVALAGTVGYALVPNPFLNGESYQFNPPVGLTTKAHNGCGGPTSGSAFDEVCRGSLDAPLGTARFGERVDFLLVAGARPTLYVAVIGAVLVIPLAVAVGVTAGLRGGLADRLLMSYVDLQLSIPAIMLYFIGFIYFSASLLLLLAAFGLWTWGGVARLVRSEVIQRREEGHVTVARSLGASQLYIAKRHIVPNITNTLMPAVGQLLALLVLYEAGVAFLGFYEVTVTSWGSMISEYINAEVASQNLQRASQPAHEIWWLSTFPAIAIALLMLSFKILGDGLRDALDPRGGR
jgi:peptide/nickel transport system permease protein